MTRQWLDTNVLLRLITRDPPDQFRRVSALMRRADAGEIDLIVTPLVIAETTWVLSSRHGYRRAETRDVLRGILTTDGIVADSIDQIVEALDLMADQNVSFEDAMLALAARDAEEPVCTFDAGFRRLPAEVVAP